MIFVLFLGILHFSKKFIVVEERRRDHLAAGKHRETHKTTKHI